MKSKAAFMQNGSEIRAPLPFLAVNNKGFICVYGLILFTIVISFITLCTTQLRVSYLLKQHMLQHDLEVYAIHHVTLKMPLYKEERKPHEETVIVWGERITFQFELQVANVTVTCENQSYTMKVSTDDNGIITSIAYF